MKLCIEEALRICAPRSVTFTVNTENPVHRRMVRRNAWSALMRGLLIRLELDTLSSKKT